jgi:hypothetical protein
MDHRDNPEEDWAPGDNDLSDEEVAAIQESQSRDDTPPADSQEVS